MKQNNSLRKIAGAGALSLILFTVAAAQTERIEPEPEELAGVGVTEHLNAEIPPELVFTDQDGRAVTLGDFFGSDRPVVLTLNYSNCPMLCHLQLNGFVDALKQLSLNLGTEFTMVTVSIDPTESPKRARLTKNKYKKMYGREGVEQGWQFLVGAEDQIKALADTVGFAYTYNEARDEYVHAAAAIVCTPDGRISRYLYGVLYDPQTVKLALLEAAEGEIGSAMDQVLLFCFHYDAEAGRYAPAAMKLMRLGGVVTVVVLGSILGVYWRRDARRKKQAPDEAGT
jgi:protein SCO1/2